MEWGIEIRKRQIVVDTMGRTTVPGIYAAGDIVDYEGKVKLIATGFGEVATAVNNAAAYLNPKVSAFPGHLSDYAPADGSTPTVDRTDADDHRRRHRRRPRRALRRGAAAHAGAGAAAVHRGRTGHRARRAAHAPNRWPRGSPPRRRWPRRSAPAAACTGPTPRCAPTTPAVRR